MEKILDIKLGFSCNNSCRFCLRRREGNGDLRTEEAVDILRKGRIEGFSRVSFTGGEPTLRRDFPHLISEARSLGYAGICLTTNGRMFAYPRFCEEAFRRGLNFVCFSIHGPDSRMHDGLTRGPGSFEQAAEGLRNAARLGKPGGVEVTATCVIVKPNAGRFVETARFLWDAGASLVVAKLYEPPSLAWKRGRDRLLVPLTGQVGIIASAAPEAGHGRRLRTSGFPACLIEKIGNPFLETDEVTQQAAGLTLPLRGRLLIGSDNARFRSCMSCDQLLQCPGVPVEYALAEPGLASILGDESGGEEIHPLFKERIPLGRLLSRDEPDLAALKLGLKPAAKYSLSAADLKKQRHFYIRQELFVKARRGALSQNLQRGGSPLFSEDMLSVFVAPDGGKLREAVRAHDRLMSAARKGGGKEELSREVGAALGYPACCIEAFTLAKNRSNMGMVLSALRRSKGVSYLLTNVDYHAFSLVPWQPCKYDCEASVMYACAVLKELRLKNPAGAEAASLFLSMPRICFDERRQLIFHGFFHGGGIRYGRLYTPANFSSTPETEKADRRFFSEVAVHLLDGNFVQLSRRALNVYKGKQLLRVVRTAGERPFFFIPGRPVEMLTTSEPCNIVTLS